MDFDDEMESEAEEFESTTLADLRAKRLIVQNSDGTLRCPLSPSRKKQSYQYKDLLQHATGVAVWNSKRGLEAVGKHSALKKYLESDLAALAKPPVERILRVEHEAPPRRRETEELLVCPWSIVVSNIDNSRRDYEQNVRIGLGKAEMKKHYADFSPEKVQVFWSPKGHMGISVLQFGLSFLGLKNAQALEKSFIDKEHGRRDYVRNLSSGSLGKEFYGWLARTEDFEGRPGQHGATIGKYLQAHCTLRDIAMIEQEMQKIYISQVQQLAQTLSKKNEEIELVRRKAEEERVQLQESFMQQLEAARFRAQKSEEEYNQAAAERYRALQVKEVDLDQRNKELEELLSSCAANKDRLENEKMKNLQQRIMITKEHELQKQCQAGKIRLVQKHEEEKKLLAEHMNRLTLMLANKQEKELEKQQLQGIIQTDKVLLSLDDDNTEEQKKIKELEEKVQDLESDVEDYTNTINNYVKKDRASTDEIQNANKLALEVLREFSKDATKKSIKAALEAARSNPVVVEVKRAGEIDISPWLNNGDDPTKMMKKLSKWQMLIQDSQFHPFKHIETLENGEAKPREIDPENEKLSSLRKKLGEEIYNSVATALLELETYNSSGRYPVPLPWVFKKAQTATLEEVIAYLTAVIRALLLSNGHRKRART